MKLVRSSVRKSQYCAPYSYQVRQQKTNFNYNRSLYFVCVSVRVYVYGLYSCVVSQTSAQKIHVVSDGTNVQATKNNSAPKNDIRQPLNHWMYGRLHGIPRTKNT